MSQVIIGVHGLGNKPPKEMLEKWWVESIREGYQLSGYSKINFNFELVYWADVFYDKPLDSHVLDKSDPLFLEEPYTPSPKDHIPEEHKIRQKVLDVLEKQLYNIFLNDDLSINFSFITDAILHSYFKELEVYYSKECIDNDKINCLARDIIRKRLADVLQKYIDDDILIIGHSMGSIIAYDVLTFTVPDIPIHTFITMGSPLGLPIIISKIASERNIRLPQFQKPKTPPGIMESWYNFSDLEDKVALIYDLTDKFEANSNGIMVKNNLVDNTYSYNDDRNPHKSFGYLRTPQFISVISQFLKKEKINFLSRVWFKMYRVYISIFYRNI